MVRRAVIRFGLLRMAFSRDPEARIDAMMERAWRMATALVGEDELRRAVEFDRALLAERN